MSIPTCSRCLLSMHKASSAVSCIQDPAWRRNFALIMRLNFCDSRTMTQFRCLTNASIAALKLARNGFSVNRRLSSFQHNRFHNQCLPVQQRASEQLHLIPKDQFRYLATSKRVIRYTKNKRDGKNKQDKVKAQSSFETKATVLAKKPNAILARAQAALDDHSLLSTGQLRYLFMQMEELPHYQLMLRIVNQQIRIGKDPSSRLWQSILASMAKHATPQDLEKVFQLTLELNIWESTTVPSTVLVSRIQCYFASNQRQQAMDLLQHHIECDKLLSTRTPLLELLRGRILADDFPSLHAIIERYPQHISLALLATLARYAVSRNSVRLAAQILMLKSDKHVAALAGEQLLPIQPLCRSVLNSIVAANDKGTAVQFFVWMAQNDVKFSPTLPRSVLGLVSASGDLAQACQVLASYCVCNKQIPSDFLTLIVQTYINYTAASITLTPQLNLKVQDPNRNRESILSKSSLHVENQDTILLVASDEDSIQQYQQ
eukprot:gene4812-108_t